MDLWEKAAGNQQPKSDFASEEHDQLSFSVLCPDQRHDGLSESVFVHAFFEYRQKEKEARIHRILQTVGLSRLENAMVNTLSGGEQQRVALARTMLKPGRLILADEPTGALDAKAAELSFSLIKGLCQKYHKTVIMVTHSLDLAQRTDWVIDLANYK